jgi:hypothetical protein
VSSLLNRLDRSNTDNNLERENKATALHFMKSPLLPRQEYCVVFKLADEEGNPIEGLYDELVEVLDTFFRTHKDVNTRDSTSKDYRVVKNDVSIDCQDDWDDFLRINAVIEE